jgi:hypothetical protein
VTHYLPEPKPTAPAAGQATPTDADRDNIRRLVAAVDEIATQQPTAVRITDPSIPSWQDGPRIGTTPPADQPGARRPPMSQRAVDLNTTILSSSVLVAVLGGAFSAVMWASGHANPTVIKWVCVCAVAVPAVIAIPVLALKSLAKAAKEVVQAAPPEIHQHYSGHVYQDRRQTHLNTTTRGVIATTRNELPPAAR